MNWMGNFLDRPALKGWNSASYLVIALVKNKKQKKLAHICTMQDYNYTHSTLIEKCGHSYRLQRQSRRETPETFSTGAEEDQ